MASLLLTPTDYLKGHPVDPDAVIAVAARLAQRRGRLLIEDPRALSAYVSAGRWVADCPSCAAGIAIHPEWSVAVCLGLTCHRVYRSLVVPDDWCEIEAVLAVRPVVHQHWFDETTRSRREGRAVRIPRETIADLVRENEAHGFPARVI